MFIVIYEIMMKIMETRLRLLILLKYLPHMTWIHQWLLQPDLIIPLPLEIHFSESPVSSGTKNITARAKSPIPTPIPTAMPLFNSLLFYLKIIKH